MHITKRNIHAVYKYFLENGVLVVKKNLFDNKHSELDVPNYEIRKIMKKLRSKECATEIFSWQHSYYTITDEGIKYLRAVLLISENTFPETVYNTQSSKKIETVSSE